MDPNKWGPHLWFFLHTISLNYPKNPTYQDKEDYNNFYMSLQHILPCSACKSHLSEHLQQEPPNLSDNISLIRWTIDLHNKVNKSLGKKQLSYEEAVILYDKYYKNASGAESLYKYDYSDKDSFVTILKYIQITVIILVIGGGLYYLFRNRRTKRVIRY